VFQHVAVQRIERGIVYVRRKHALAETVEHHHASRATQPAKRLLVQLGQTRELDRKTSSRTDFRL
jgi:hypothetical protein